MMKRSTRLAAALMSCAFFAACSRPAGQPEPAPAAAVPSTPAMAPAPAAGAPATAEAAPASAVVPAEGLPPVTTPAARLDRARPAEAPMAPAGAAAETAPASAPAPPAGPVYRELTIPAGTALAIDLRTTVGSDTSQVEDRVSAALRQPVSIRGDEVLPAGTTLIGHVTAASRPARVKGKGRVSFRFTSLDLPGAGGVTPIRTSLVVREAAATKREDAAKIGAGAAGGALLGAILGGGGGAAKGAAIGGAAGTGVVLSTRGQDVRVPVGTNLVVKLQEAITIRVRR